MCSKEEQDGMVGMIKKAGWVRSVIVTAGLLLGLYATATGITGTVKADISEDVDKKIKIHTLESEVMIDKRFDQVERQQLVDTTKLDLLLQDRGIEVPE